MEFDCHIVTDIHDGFTKNRVWLKGKNILSGTGFEPVFHSVKLELKANALDRSANLIDV